MLITLLYGQLEGVVLRVSGAFGLLDRCKVLVRTSRLNVCNRGGSRNVSCHIVDGRESLVDSPSPDVGGPDEEIR